MRWISLCLPGVFLLYLSLAFGDDHYDPSYPEYYNQVRLARRQDPVDIIANNPLGVIGVLAVGGIVAGGLAVAQAGTSRTMIQNSINALSTSVSSLESSSTTARTTLTTAQTQSTKNVANANQICSFLATTGALV
eukprot:maker-scaffold396_size184579-snap-gene-0.22 protein:Tk06609 transcript:maker-scaffold396_size184579-snap-gene-0.22-mRNA-1 annotation:"diguanylate cyclase phosphodiesterase with pas pac sensor"